MEQNYLKLDIKAVLDNVSVVRVAIATFISNMDITIDELMDVKTAVSEAVTNSIEHGYDEYNKGNVKVEAYIIQDEYEFVKIIVRDNGVGMDKSFIEKAFSRYSMGKNNKHSEEKGTGIGLCVVKKMVEEQRGRIDLKSSLGQGTSIEIVFEKEK